MKNLLTFLIIIASMPCLLIVLPAPLNILWRFKIGVTELGYFMVIPMLLLMIVSVFYTRRWASVLAFISAIIYVLPLLSSYIVSFNLKNHLIFAYGVVDEPPHIPLSFWQLVGFTTKSDIKPKNIIYSRVNDKELDLDLYANHSPKLKPCIVSVHGGAWSSGDNTMFVDFDTYFASIGYVVADVNYRLAPDNIFPAQEEDIVAAIAYLKANASKYHVDVRNIFLLGRSAGGQIADVTAFHLGKKQIRGLITFYTPHDMVWGYSVPGNPLILDSRKVLANYLGGTLQEATANFFAASPAHQVNKNAPPILMIHGESDEMVAYEHNLRLIEKLKEKKIPHYLLSLPHATHGCDYFFDSQSSQLSTFAIEYFLRRYTVANK